MCHCFYCPADYEIAGKSFRTYWHHKAGDAYQHLWAVVGLEKQCQSVFKETIPMEIFNYYQPLEFLTVCCYCHHLLTP